MDQNQNGVDRFSDKDTTGVTACVYRLSIIIPVFNGSAFLEACLDSIEKQGSDRCQVILIDDGSTDGSWQILEDYQKQSIYDVLLLKTGENGGSGKARNLGLDHAAGEYILFIDQDDTIADDYCLTLLSTIDETGADAVFSGYQTMDEAGRILSRVALKDTPWSRYMNITPWGKVFRRSFLEKYRLRFAALPLGEDVYLTIRCLVYAEKTAVSDYVGYRWRQNRKSYSHTAHERVGKESDLLALYDQLITISPDPKGVLNSPEFEYFLIKTITYQVLKTLRGSSFHSVRANEKRLHAWMRQHYPSYRKNPLLAGGTPDGERRRVAWIVKGYMFLTAGRA